MRNLLPIALILAAAAELHAQGTPSIETAPPGSAPIVATVPTPPPGVMWTPPPPPPPLPRRSFSLTFSPVHLMFPIVELTGELRAADKLGIALIGAAGELRVTSGTSRSLLAIEAGGSLRYYLTGSFDRGMQLGAEALYVHVRDGDLSTSAFASGLSVGPFVGYKWTGRSGFTFDGQVGIAYAAIKAQSGSSTAQAKKVYPLLNLNIGWSF